MNHMPSRLVIFVLLSVCYGSSPDDELPPNQLIGYTELRTDLSGGRHANVRTMRAAVINADGSEHRHMADELVTTPMRGLSLQAARLMAIRR